MNRSARSRKEKQQTSSSWSTSSVLGALGLGSAAAATAYYKYDPQGAQVTYDSAKQALSSASTYVADHIKNTDPKTLALEALGGAALGYIAYKTFASQQSEPELEVKMLESDEFLQDLGSHTSQSGRRRVGKSDPEYALWLKEAGTLFWQVFSHIRDENRRKEAVKPYIKIVTKDPHELLRDEKFIDRLSKAQKVVLLQIFVAYTTDRIFKASHTLAASLNSRQSGVRGSLENTLEAAQSSRSVGILIDCFEELLAQGRLSDKQADFIEGELEFLKECHEKQSNFNMLYSLDTLLADKLR